MSVAVSSKASSMAVAVALFAVAFVAAAVLHQAVQRLGWLPWVSSSDTAASEPVAGAPGWSAWGATPPVVAGPLTTEPPTVPLTGWRASLLLGGQRHALDGASIALPTGARFQVALHGLPAGNVMLHVINPQGVAAVRPLWTARVRSGHEVVSPTLRLQGARGVESLRVVHRDTRGVVREGTVHVWHL